MLEALQKDVAQLKAGNLDNFTADCINMPEMENGMAKRQKFHVTLPTGEKVWLTGSTISEAFANGLEKYGMAQRQEPASVTLREYGDKWFAMYHVTKVKPNTAANTRIYLDKHIYPILGDKPIADITADDVQSLFNSMNKYARSTVNKIKVTLSQIFKRAKRAHLVADNIMAGGDYSMNKNVTEREALSPEQARSVEANLSKLSGNELLFLSIALYAGMRRGEILALKWDDIDFDNSVIHVGHAVTFANNRPVVGPPKSKAGIRTIPINPALYKILSVNRGHSGYVIKNHKDQAIPMTGAEYRKMWERITKKIELYGATAHCLRHTYATMNEPHTSPKTLQSILGHSDFKTTGRYIHRTDESIKALTEINVYAT